MGKGEAGEGVAEVAVEPLLGAEDQAAGVGVQPVGADDQVEGAMGATVEGDIDTVSAVVQGGDGVVEHELDLVAHRGVEGVRQVATSHFEVQALRAPGDDFGPDGADGGSIGDHEGQFAGVDVRGSQLREQPHAVRDVAGRAADVDGIAAAADRGRLLDDGDFEAVAVEPVGQ